MSPEGATQRALRRRRRDRDGLRARSHRAGDLPLGPDDLAKQTLVGHQWKRELFASAAAAHPSDFTSWLTITGCKENILRCPRQKDFGSPLCHAATSADETAGAQSRRHFSFQRPGRSGSVFLCAFSRAHLMGQKPDVWRCSRPQILGFAFGGSTFKLKFGHRGGNQPVQDLRSGKVAITSQNHGFAVDPKSLPPEVEVTHVNLNDGTVEGMRHKELPIFTVQHHPEAAPGPHDASPFLAQFADLIDKEGEKQSNRAN